MAKNTEISLRNKVIYSVYVRNHTNDGTFNAVAEDLDRIKSLLMQTRTIAQQIPNTAQWTISRALLKKFTQRA